MSDYAEVRAQMALELHPACFYQWIEPLEEAGVQSGRLVLVGTPRVIAWVARRYAHRLGQLARERMGLQGVVLQGTAR